MTRDARKVTREPATTSLAVQVLARFVAGRGDARARAWLQEAGLAPGFDDPDAEWPLSTFAGLWHEAARIEPAIGLQLLHRFEPEQMHFVAHIVLRAATLREGLQAWCRYAGLVSPNDVLELHEQGPQARLVYRSVDRRHHLPWMAEHYGCLALAFLRRFVQERLALDEVAFSHQPAVAEEIYRERFGCPVRFAQAEDGFAFRREHLELPLAKADPYLRHFLEQQAAARLAQVRRQLSLAEQVREACARLLAEHRLASLEHVAELLGTGESALQRQLHAQEANFRDLLDEAKKQVAEELLRRGLPLVLISDQLGFAEPSVLQRACKRWFGASAGEVRKRLAATA